MKPLSARRPAAVAAVIVWSWLGSFTGQPVAAAETALATFAGGCFWCMEEAFDKLPGVLSTTSGYTGGTVPDPDYAQVSAGGTGHAEALRVEYDPARIGYQQLLVAFWHNIDPLQANGQFCDIGRQYRSAIFAHTQEQRRLAEESLRYLEAAAGFERPVVTEIAAAGPFYPAEDYHQDYYLENPVRYRLYKYQCGRARRLEQLWGAKPAPS